MQRKKLVGRTNRVQSTTNGAKGGAITSTLIKWGRKYAEEKGLDIYKVVRKTAARAA